MRRYGIDLGTTNTCIFQSNFAFYDESEYELSRVEIRYEKRGDLLSVQNGVSMPSVIYANKGLDDKYTYYIGEVAQKMAKADNMPDIINTKRLLCRDVPETPIAFGLNAQDVARKLLEGCRYSLLQLPRGPARLANADTTVCVTQPAAFNIFASRSIPIAAQQAGFQNVTPLREPIAALMSYLYQILESDSASEELFKRQSKRKKLLTLVVDIGGGTTDVTIQEIQIEGSRAPDMDAKTYTGYVVHFLNQSIQPEFDGETQGHAAANQEPAFGGMDFDTAILREIMMRFSLQYREQMGANLEWEGDIGKKNQYNLYDQVKNYKESLSTYVPGKENKGHFSILYDFGRKELNCNATAQEFYEWSRPLCDRPEGDKDSDRTVYAIISDTIRRSGYRVKDIDYMFVTGGMSSYVPVRNMLKEKFSFLLDAGKLKFSDTPLDDIARGAAICNSYFKVDMPISILFSDYMIDDPCGEPHVIAKQNTPLPVEGELPNFMELRNPSFCYVDVLYGAGTRDSALRKLKHLRKPLSPPMPIGTKISVKYSIDTSQALDVFLTLHDPKNGDREIELLKLIEQKPEEGADK